MCIRDRSYAMRGYYTPYIPGWDNHGMPIESAIIKEQKLNRKQMSVPEFRTACHDYAEKYVDIQREGFKRLGVVEMCIRDSFYTDAMAVLAERSVQACRKPLRHIFIK